MVTTRDQALEIAGKARAGLEAIYGERLRGVYLYGSAARDQLTEDSDIDIAVVLDRIPNRSREHERTSQLGCDISLEHGTVVLFFFTEQADLEAGRFAIYRDIKQEGVRLCGERCSNTSSARPSVLRMHAFCWRTTGSPRH